MDDALPIWIFGAGGHGRVVADAARSSGHALAGFVDDHPAGTEIDGLPVVQSGDASWWSMGHCRFVVAVGSNVARARIYRDLTRRGGEPVSIVHRTATISPRARIGPGSVVFGGVVVNPGAIVGANCILNTSCSVDHDCLLGDHVHLCPGVRLAGTVTVQDGAMLGTGAVVVPGRTIGEWAMIGAGSMIARDAPPRRVVFGNPARVIRMVLPAELPEDVL